VKAVVRIPVIANGDITTPQKAKRRARAHRRDGVMIGRAAQGRPWIFREIEHFLATGEEAAAADGRRNPQVLRGHLADLYAFYGSETGVRVARKHISWYTKGLAGSAQFRHAMNQPADDRGTARRVERFLGLARAERAVSTTIEERP
jgi:tRNA-dihydrouridine synthase B